MIFQRTIARFAAERADIHPALKKVWKKYYKVDGLLTQHLSPFEQNIVTPLIKELPMKFLKRSKEIIAEAGLGLGFGYFVYEWGNAEHKNIAYHHRL